MPYIDVKVTPELNKDEKDLMAKKLGELISIIPGKSESSLMINITDNSAVYFGGKVKQKAAFVDIRIYGKAEQKYKEQLISAVSDELGSAYGIQKSDIYINFFEMQNWGLNGRFI